MAITGGPAAEGTSRAEVEAAAGAVEERTESSERAVGAVVAEEAGETNGHPETIVEVAGEAEGAVDGVVEGAPLEATGAAEVGATIDSATDDAGDESDEDANAAVRAQLRAVGQEVIAATEAMAGESCVICNTVVQVGVSVAILPCGHTYHARCAAGHVAAAAAGGLGERVACPLCRARVAAVGVGNSGVVAGGVEAVADVDLRAAEGPVNEGPRETEVDDETRNRTAD